MRQPRAGSKRHQSDIRHFEVVKGGQAAWIQATEDGPDRAAVADRERRQRPDAMDVPKRCDHAVLLLL